mgnify:CR=1 FL=1
MNKKIVFAVLLVLVLTLSCSFFVACNDKSPENLRDVDKDSTEYRVFFDDFNGELDTTYWNVHHELRRGGYWDKDQAFKKTAISCFAPYKKRTASSIWAQSTR